MISWLTRARVSQEILSMLQRCLWGRVPANRLNPTVMTLHFLQGAHYSLPICRHTLGWITFCLLVSGSHGAVLLLELLKTGTNKEVQVLCCDTVHCRLCRKGLKCLCLLRCRAVGLPLHQPSVSCRICPSCRPN